VKEKEREHVREEENMHKEKSVRQKSRLRKEMLVRDKKLRLGRAIAHLDFGGACLDYIIGKDDMQQGHGAKAQCPVPRSIHHFSNRQIHEI